MQITSTSTRRDDYHEGINNYMRGSPNSAAAGLPEKRKQQLSELLGIARPVIGDELIRQPELDQAVFSSIRQTVADEFRGQEIDLEKTFLKRLIIAVGYQYKTRLPALKVKFDSLENNAAAFVQTRSGQWYVHFNTRFSGDDTRLTMLVAHELAHVVLAQHRVFLQPRRRNEELTDTLAILAGFGSIYQAGHKVIIQQPSRLFDKALTSREGQLGYLNRYEIAYLLAEKAKIRK